jgi:hypothetical protein
MPNQRIGTDDPEARRRQSDLPAPVVAKVGSAEGAREKRTTDTDIGADVDDELQSHFSRTQTQR